MNGSALRPVWIELRRGSAPFLAAASATTGIVMLFVHPEDWAGRWLGLATYLWTELVLLVPLVAAVACWQAGRERRRGIQDLLASTPRPGWQSLAAGWMTLTAAATCGLTLTWLVGVMFVAPHASYTGGGWPWLSAGTILPLAAAAALGLAVGRAIPSKLTGLPLAVLLYVLIAMQSYGVDGGTQWLVPYLDGAFSDHRLTPDTYLWQNIWFGGLAIGLLTVAVIASRPAGRRPLVSGPLLLAAVLMTGTAAVAGTVLAMGPGMDRWIRDPGAGTPVCTHEGPSVCMTRTDAFLLDEVATQVQPALRRLSDVPGAPVRAVETVYQQPPPEDVLWISSPAADVFGRLQRSGPWSSDPAADALGNLFAWCLRGTEPAPPLSDEQSQQSFTASEIATAWALGRTTPVNPGFAQPGLTGLRSLPAATQRTWIGDYLSAAHRCDAGALSGLIERIGAQ